MNAALIGCGRMGAFTSDSVKRFAPECWFPLSHAEAIQRHPELTLSALCDANPRSLQRAVAAYGVGKAYTNHRALLDEVHPDLVGIATRTIGRAQIIQDAAATGARAFHVEKPLCNSMREATALADLFSRSDLFLTYGTVRRFFGIYQAARDLALSGRYGALREIRVNMGEASLFWTHPHSVDLILFAAGERAVEAVQARLSNVELAGPHAHVRSDPVVESASIFFDGGIAGHITRAPGADLVLSCSDGEVIVVNDGRALRVSAREGDDPYPSVSEPAEPVTTTEPQGTLAPISQLVRCLHGEPAARLANLKIKQDVVRGQRVLFALVQSHMEASRLVSLQQVDPDMRIDAKTGENYA